MKIAKTLILVSALLALATPARTGEAVQEEARQRAMPEAPVAASDETQEAPVAASDELLAAVGPSDGTVAASDEKAVFEIGELNRGPSSNLETCSEGCTSGIRVCNATCRTVAGGRVCVGDGIVCCLNEC